jgi:hypothetical protein
MIGAVWKIEWNNPYTNPPEGMPRILAEFFYNNDDPRSRLLPSEVNDFYTKHNLQGNGYGIYWQSVHIQKTLDQGKLASIRKKRLQRRMSEKYPLFAAQFIAEELEKKPEYYSGITDARINQKRASILEAEESHLHELLDKRVIVYFDGA